MNSIYKVSLPEEFNPVINHNNGKQEECVVCHIAVKQFLAGFVAIHHERNVLSHDHNQQQGHLVLDAFVDERNCIATRAHVHHPG